MPSAAMPTCTLSRMMRSDWTCLLTALEKRSYVEASYSLMSISFNLRNERKRRQHFVECCMSIRYIRLVSSQQMVVQRSRRQQRLVVVDNLKQNITKKKHTGHLHKLFLTAGYQEKHKNISRIKITLNCNV